MIKEYVLTTGQRKTSELVAEFDEYTSKELFELLKDIEFVKEAMNIALKKKRNSEC